MIASELKAQFEKTPVISLFDLAQQLKKDPILIKQLLKSWERKGRVRQMPKTSACGERCSRCPIEMTIVYHYKG